MYYSKRKIKYVFILIYLNKILNYQNKAEQVKSKKTD